LSSGVSHNLVLAAWVFTKLNTPLFGSLESEMNLGNELHFIFTMETIDGLF